MPASVDQRTGSTGLVTKLPHEEWRSGPAIVLLPLLALIAWTTPGLALAGSSSVPGWPMPGAVPRPVVLETGPPEVARSDARAAGVAAAGEPVPGPAAETRPPAAGLQVTLRFLDAPIESIVRAIAEAAGISYVLAPDVSGRLTVVTQVPIPADQVVGLLLAALEAHGFTAVAAGLIYKIVRIEGARERAVPTARGTALRPGRGEDEIVTHIVPVRFRAATDLVSQLRPTLSARGHIGAHGASNSLLVTDSAANVARALEIVRILDVEGAFEGLEVFPLRIADASSLAATLNRIFSSGAAPGLPARPAAPRGPEGRPADDRPVIIGDRRANALIVHGRPDQLASIRRLMAQLDADFGQRGRVMVYQAEHAKAVELAATLRASYAEVDPHTRFVPDATTNTLFVVTSPPVWTAIEASLRQLDRAPRQVRIEVVAVEVDLTDEQRLGIDWAAVIGSLTVIALTGPVPTFDPVTGLLPLVALSSPGLSGLVTSTDVALILLRTLAVTNRALMTARPQILAAEGKRAVLNVSDSIPIVTAPASPGVPAAALSGLVNQVVEYRDAGVVLNVQPRIGDDGTIGLDVRQEVSELGAREPFTGSPQILKREVETSVVLRDTQTLVLGGLVRELREMAERGVPGLQDVPVLGRLFRTTQELITRRELLILVTPRIVPQPESSKP